MGDDGLASNGVDACNQRLGMGNTGAKTDGAFNTGLDDLAEMFPVGSSGTVPASSARFRASWSGGAATPAFNLVTALAFRDQATFLTADTDGLAKLDVTLCPILAGAYACGSGESVLDPDNDGVLDPADDCPTIPNPDQADVDADGVGDACDNCLRDPNPRVAAGFLAANAWATLTGGQRDDDHDGYGNRCDAKFVGAGLVGAADLAQFRASANRSRALDTCGSAQNRPCAIFDLDEADVLIGGPDLARFRSLNNKLPGPKCPMCPLPCTAGTAGTCGPVPP